MVQAIIGGTAPPPARLAAARGMLPLPQNDLLEVLVALANGDNQELSTAATETLTEQEASDLLAAAKADDVAPTVLSYLATHEATKDIHEALILNSKTPDAALATLAQTTPEGSLVELIALNQQRLVRFPDIIEAILSNPKRTGEAERRARETKKEFFEKERGARQIAEELRAQGKTAAAEFFEAAELTSFGADMSLEDAWIIAQHIEVSDDDIDDSWLPAERYEELFAESAEEVKANYQRMVETERLSGDASPERLSLIRRVMFMKVKDRMKLGMKGDREARSILIRDSNRIVSTAVVNNPRITEHEIENIASMRTVAEEVLRIIALNRAWARSYPIIHNLARNPRTPIPSVVNILPRIRTKDLKNLTQNRNVSEAVRKQAYRLSQVRSGE